MDSSLLDSGSEAKNYSAINGHADDLYSRRLSKTNAWKNFIERNQGLITALILLALAILNMADRYVISSVLIDIQQYFNISKSATGLLQTIYLLSFMFFSPLGGYMGDRFNRKYILIASSVIWLASIIGGSYVQSSQLGLFIFSRVIFGGASALFETIGIPIIGDRFKDDPKVRNRAIIAYTVGPGIGAGLAYFISLVAKDIRPHDWRFSMRITPIFLALTLLITVFGYIEPKRAHHTSEMETLLDGAESSNPPKKSKHFLKDVKVLWKNKTFLLLIVSWTAGLATAGATVWWSSTMIEYSLTFHHLPKHRKVVVKKAYSLQQAVCGVIGLISPGLITSYYKKRGVELIDCYILVVGFFLASFFQYIYLVTLEINAYLTMLIAIPMSISFSLSWLSGFNIFLDIVHPSMRSTALSLFFFVLHLVGDSVSPYWVGLIAQECIKAEGENTISVLLGCTRLSYYPLVYLSLFASALGLFSSLTFKRDKQNAIDFQH